MDSLTPNDIAALVSVGVIARRNGHSRVAVSKAINRLEIKPVLQSPYRLFHPSVVATLKGAMRQPGKTRR